MPSSPFAKSFLMRVCIYINIGIYKSLLRERGILHFNKNVIRSKNTHPSC